jgi:dynein assembly factor with WDR repeat domains 1
MGNKAKLRKLMLRFYPPGLILQYDVGGFVKQKPIDLLDISVDTDLEVGALTSPVHGMCWPSC